MPEWDDTVRSELSTDEELLWSSQPGQGLRLRAQDALLIPFSLMWGGFAVFWEASVLRAPRAPAFFALWGVPFVLIGAYMVAGRFFWDAWRRRKTWYAVTNRRALIITGTSNRQVKSLSLGSLGELTLTEKGDGSGTLTLGSSASPFGMWAGSGWPGSGRYAPPAFEMIESVRTVRDLITTAQRSASTAR